MDQILHIKYMVCDRCINVVEQTFIRFEIPFNKISLGEVVLKHALTPKEKKLIQDEFQQVGFEIIADRNEMIVNRIKSLIINSIYEDHNYSNKNLSQILTETLLTTATLVQFSQKWRAKVFRLFSLLSKLKE
jgi:hypothetical protein